MKNLWNIRRKVEINTTVSRVADCPAQPFHLSGIRLFYVSVLCIIATCRLRVCSMSIAGRHIRTRYGPDTELVWTWSDDGRSMENHVCVNDFLHTPVSCLFTDCSNRNTWEVLAS